MKLLYNKFMMEKQLFFRMNIIIILSFAALYLGAAELKIVDTAGCNLDIVGKAEPSTYSLKSKSHAQNWFSAVFEGVDTSIPTTFTLNMDNTGNAQYPGNVSKWVGLYPVYSYARYWDYNNFVYYIKNADGYWVSSDMFASEILAGNGKTPIQTVIPEELAEEFLSEDGGYWSPWQEIEETKALIGTNTFTLTKQFNSSVAAIAMRVPYTYDYEYQYMRKLQAADIDGVTVHNIGTSNSASRQHLYAVEVSDPKSSEEELENRRVVLMYANEDGDEPDGCWVVNGAMNYLIRGLQENDAEVQTILAEATFLFIPLLDPAGWRTGSFAELAYSFYAEQRTEIDSIRKEVLSYATFISSWCGDKNRHLDIACSMHSIECAEGPNVIIPFADSWTSETYILDELINNILIEVQEYKTAGDMGWRYYFQHQRFSGWCRSRWGSIPLLSEINSRYPAQRLNMYDMEKLGERYVKGFYNFFFTEEYERALPQLARSHEYQTTARNEFLAENKTKGVMDILQRGY